MSLYMKDRTVTQEIAILKNCYFNLCFESFLKFTSSRASRSKTVKLRGKLHQNIFFRKT